MLLWGEWQLCKITVGMETKRGNVLVCFVLFAWSTITHPGDLPAGAAVCLFDAQLEIWQSNTR